MLDIAYINYSSSRKWSNNVQPLWLVSSWNFWRWMETQRCDLSRHRFILNRWIFCMHHTL